MENLGIPGMNLNAITSGAGGFNVTRMSAPSATHPVPTPRKARDRNMAKI